MLINERSDEIALFYQEWKDNRAIIKGERAVKAPGSTFLPRDEGVSFKAHQNMLQRTTFHPMAARTHEGLKALASHKPALTLAPPSVEDILRTITRQGYNLDKLANRLFSELLITNFVGLVVDYPSASGPITQAQAIAQGIRPWVGMYTAENILRVETGAVNTRQRATHVVLQDDDTNIRELRLDEGVYSVTKWRCINGQWTPIETVTPTKGGKVIDEIPFTIVSTEDDFEPTKAPLADVCALNKQLFLASSMLAACHWWGSSPVPIITKKVVPDEPAISIAPGVVWRFDCLPNEAKAEYLEWKGANVGELRAEVEALKADLAKNGLRMLADERAGVEAAETAAIRRASENAILANLVRVRDEGLNDALAWLAWWLDLPEDAITYEGSTDFNSIPLDTPSLVFRKSLKDDGTISKDAYLDILIANEVLPETFDREADAQKIAEEIADRPPAITVPIANDNTNPDGEGSAIV